MLEYLLRFIAGGIAVSAFAAFGDAVRPKSFAGLFGAAPSIALAIGGLFLAFSGDFSRQRDADREACPATEREGAVIRRPPRQGSGCAGCRGGRTRKLGACGFRCVTKEGLAAIEVALGRFEAAHRAAIDKSDTQAAAAAQREIRYWRARRASAEVITPSTDKSRASFGMTVTLRRADGRKQTFRIVGEDEADPPRGTVSYVCPLARAVLTYAPGETVEIAGEEAVILEIR